MFGRKKRQKEEKGVEEAAPNEEEDLAVAYGTVDEVKDDGSTTESLPPPPPGEVKVAKNEEMANEDSPVESQSVGAVDDVDDSTDEKDTAEMIKLKKLLVIVGCAISFIIMLALAIKYGQVRKQAAKESESNSQVIAAPTLAPVETSPPTIASTTVPTEFDPFRKCEENGISVLTSCTNTGASALFNFCLVEDVTDQFWEFVSTPPRVPLAVANDWGWLRDGASDEIAFLPEGIYEIGLFSNGEQNLQQYPLLSSTEFIVDCSQA